MAIISLLVSILIPSLSRAKELARRAVCMSNLKQIGLVFNYYQNENDGFFIFNDGPWLGATWMDMVRRYNDVLDLYACPSARPVRCEGLSFPLEMAPYVYATWDDADWLASAYGLNGTHDDPGPPHPPKSRNPPVGDFVQVSDLEDATATLWAADYVDWSIGMNSNSPAVDIWNESVLFWGGRHFGDADVLFCDGHVSCHGPDELNNSNFTIELD